jgi:hypothetical protein
MKKKVERETKPITRVQTQQTKGVREKKRKVTEVMSDVSTDDDGNKENSHPNLPHIKPPLFTSARIAYACRVVTVENRSVLRLRPLNKMKEPVKSERNEYTVM